MLDSVDQFIAEYHESRAMAFLDCRLITAKLVRELHDALYYRSVHLRNRHEDDERGLAGEWFVEAASTPLAATETGGQ